MSVSRKADLLVFKVALIFSVGNSKEITTLYKVGKFAQPGDPAKQTCDCIKIKFDRQWRIPVGVEDLFNTVKFYNSSLPFVKYQLLIEAV